MHSTRVVDCFLLFLGGEKHCAGWEQNGRLCVSLKTAGLSPRVLISRRHSPARMQLLRVAWALAGAAICCFVVLLIHSRLLKEGNCLCK